MKTVEFAGISNRPNPGSKTELYLDTATGVYYRWTGAAFATMGSNTDELTPAMTSTDANNNTVLVDGSGTEYRVSRGSLALVGAYNSWDGTVFGTASIVHDAALSGSSLGTTLHWKVEVHNDFGRDAFKPGNIIGTEDLTAEPSKIYVPPGCTKVSVNASIFFGAQTGGLRWIRLTRDATETHLSSFMVAESSGGVVGQQAALATGWIPCEEGQYFELHAIQNSGVDINLQTGTATAAAGGSTYFRIEFQ